jgi:hypothetical protein
MEIRGKGNTMRETEYRRPNGRGIGLGYGDEY